MKTMVEVNISLKSREVLVLNISPTNYQSLWLAWENYILRQGMRLWINLDHESKYDTRIDLDQVVAIIGRTPNVQGT